MRMGHFKILGLFAILAVSCVAVHLDVQSRAVEAYNRWMPGSPAVSYQSATYDDRIVNHLRTEANSMRIAEIGATETHRQFIIPLNFHMAYQRFGVVYGPHKNYFASFRMPWDSASQVAVFDGIGVVNGIKQRFLNHALKDGLDTFTPAEYGIILHVP